MAETDGAQQQSVEDVSQLVPEQIKEAFSLLDKDGDGVIGISDLQSMLLSLGDKRSQADVQEMFALMPSPLNFVAYFTAISAFFKQLDFKVELNEAFAAFDVNETGKLDIGELREAMLKGQSPLTENQLHLALHTTAHSKHLDYTGFTDSLL